MQTFSPKLIAIFCSLALAACSVSRGGDEVYVSKYLTEKPKSPSTHSPSTGNSASSPSQGTSSPPTGTIVPFKDPTFVPSNDGTLFGALIHVKKDGSTLGQNPVNDGYEMLNELRVDDKRILLFNSNELLQSPDPSGFKVLSNKDVVPETPIEKTVSGFVGGWGAEGEYDPRIFRNIRFGVLSLEKESTLFVQGYVTPIKGVETVRGKQLYSMPKSGAILYNQGYALYGRDGDYQRLKAEVEADFDTKKLSVVIQDQNEQKQFDFSANIEGNTFVGKSNGIESKGAFYGSRANEVGGIFYRTEGNDKGKNGVFGAVDKIWIKR